MKQLLLLAGFMCWGLAGAQDLILLRNADEVKAEVTEITDDAVLYKLWEGDGKVLSAPHSAVFSITYANGERELFSDAKSTAAQSFVAADYPWPKVTRTYQPGDLFDEDGVRGLVISVTDGGRHGLILSLEQARLPWIGEQNKSTLCVLTLGLLDRQDGWNNRLRIGEWLRETNLTLSDFPAFDWCESLGTGWYLPAVDELNSLWSLCGGIEGGAKVSFGDYNAVRKRFNTISEGYGGDKLSAMYTMLFWSSTERSNGLGLWCGNGLPNDAYLNGYKETWKQTQERGWGKEGILLVRAVHKF